MKKPKTKVFQISLRLLNVGPKSRKKLRAMGLDEHLTFVQTEVVFTDTKNRGFDSPMFAVALRDAQEQLKKRSTTRLESD